ncbi:MAG TPA: hypothetical protein VF064_02760 [Pyrinomonadaceae bacterium]
MTRPGGAGLQFWRDQIESCGADQECRKVRRVNVSAAFFLSIEFQETGFLAYRVHKAAYGDLPARPVPVQLREFLADARAVGEGVEVGVGDWQARLEANKASFAAEFVTRGQFTSLYPPAMTPAEFVDALNANAGGALSPPASDALVNRLERRNRDAGASPAGGGGGRDLRSAETNKAFVLMQYFGYLRRNPDDPQDTNFDGYFFWLDKLNRFDGNFVEAEMVKAFISSIEYRQRFGQ